MGRLGTAATAARTTKSLAGACPFRAEYHPGNLTDTSPWKAQDAGKRDVEDRAQPVLYDAQDRPIYRRAGY